MPPRPCLHQDPQASNPSHRAQRISQSSSWFPPPLPWAQVQVQQPPHEVLCCPIKGPTTRTIPPPALEGKARYESFLSINARSQMVEARLGQVGGPKDGPITDSPQGRKRRHSCQLLSHQGPQGAEGPGPGISRSGLPHPAGQRRAAVRTMHSPCQAWITTGSRGPFPHLTRLHPPHP